MTKEQTKLKKASCYPSGVYETTYGNAAAYKTRRSTAWDLDMAERISLDSVDFTKFIRKLDEFDKAHA